MTGHPHVIDTSSSRPSFLPNASPNRRHAGGGASPDESGRQDASRAGAALLMHALSASPPLPSGHEYVGPLRRPGEHYLDISRFTERKSVMAPATGGAVGGGVGGADEVADSAARGRCVCMRTVRVVF